MFGILAWVILKVLTKKVKDIPWVMWISALLFAIRIYTPVYRIFSMLKKVRRFFVFQMIHNKNVLSKLFIFLSMTDLGKFRQENKVEAG